jgi:uncharacterized membrane protein YbhN (UPF0104 family)
VVHFSKKTKKTLIATLVSAVFTLFLAMSIDWQEAAGIFRNGVSAIFLLLFSTMAFAIALIYGFRWRLLLNRKLEHSAALASSILCLGGNMFLPARGGDLLRVHYSHVVAGMPHAEVLSKLFLEKVIDLVTIVTVGVLATVVLRSQVVAHDTSVLAVLTSTALGAVIAVTIAIKYFGEALLRGIRPAFDLAGLSAFFERHVVHIVRDIRQGLTVPTMMLPAILTLAMWLSVYAASYILIAQFVGVGLSYQESLLVLFAGALGLMLPAAPSGVGTFHASVVSAFILLGRSPAEGLLVGTAIHLLFFLAYALPAAILYGRWRLGRKALR